MVENLIQSINLLKLIRRLKSLDFDTYKEEKYSALRNKMAAISCNDETFFGLNEPPIWPENFGQLWQEDQVTVKSKIKIQEELTVKGKSRMQEKTKETRLSFSKAAVLGLRSGTGKLVFEHYER